MKSESLFFLFALLLSYNCKTSKSSKTETTVVKDGVHSVLSADHSILENSVTIEQKSNTEPRLGNMNWYFIKFADGSMPPEDIPRPFIYLDTSSMVFNGHTGCGPISGNFHNENYHLKIESSMTSKAICSQESFASRYLKSISQIHSFKIKEREMLLYDKNGKLILLFSL